MSRLARVRALAALIVAPLMGTTAATQRQFPPGYIDPAPILAAARRAIGTDNLRCVTIAGYAGALGQARESARNTDWPRIDSLAHYTRTMNWDSWTMKEEFDPVAVPDSVRSAAFPMHVDVERLADGVYLIGGGTHNSVAVEFAGFIAVYDAPLSEARSLAVIEEVVRRIPDKPIRFVVNSHQHFDHTGGLRAYNHIGATLITHWKNFDFLNRDVINYVPRTLRPDMVSLWPPTELAEAATSRPFERTM